MLERTTRDGMIAIESSDRRLVELPIGNKLEIKSGVSQYETRGMGFILQKPKMSRGFRLEGRQETDALWRRVRTGTSNAEVTVLKNLKTAL